MRRRFIWISVAAVILICGLSSGSSAPVDVTISVGVDTTDAERKAVLELWVDYLNSQPDAIWLDSDWNAAKSQYWRDFDLTAPFVYMSPSDSILVHYAPTVMQIDKSAKGRYSIRTLFYGDGVEPKGRKPWAIIRVYAERDDGAWKLRNALGVLTQGWHRPAIGKITFVSPPGHTFDVSRAIRSVAFCDSICKVFDFFRWDPFEFYVTESREAADDIIGLEYCLVGSPTGRALRSQDILISGAGTEWYPNGLAKMVATGPGLDPHRIVSDGFAGWVGGWDNRSYPENMAEAAATLAADDTIEFGDFLSDRQAFGLPGDRFFPGAVLCDMAFAARGIDGIETLFTAGSSDDALYRGIELVLGLDRRAFQHAWRERVLEFAR